MKHKIFLKRKKHSISFKMVCFYIIVNSLLLAFFGGVSTFISSNAVENEVKSYTKKTLEQATLILDQNLTDVRSRMMLLTSYNSVINCLTEEINDYSQTLEAERITNTILKDINLFKPTIEDILIIGNNGYIYNLAKRSDLISNYDFVSQTWYQEAIDVSDNVYIKMLGLHSQDFYTYRTKPIAYKQPTISISMVVNNSNRQPIGAIVCNFNLEELGNQLMSSNYEKSGKIALIDENGIVVSQNDNTLVGDKLDLSENVSKLIYSKKSGNTRDFMYDKEYLVFFDTSEISGWKLVSYIPINEIRNHSQPINNSIILFLFICLVCNVGIAYAYSKSIKKPVQLLTQSVAGIDEANLSLIPNSYPYSELDLIADRFNELLTRLDLLIKRDYFSQIELNRFQLWALQSQINPHFLFNTLQLLQTEIVYNNVKTSNDIIVSLSKLLRYTMYNSDADVMIEEEINYIKDYLSLFIKKYNDNLSVRYQIQEACINCLMPKLILQPIVENCLKHAFSSDPHDAVICIDITSCDGEICIKIMDNGRGIEKEKAEKINQILYSDDTYSGNIGLKNVHKRIQMIYGNSYGLTITSNHGGTVVVMRIPKNRGDSEE